MRMRTVSGAVVLFLSVANCGNPDGFPGDKADPSPVGTELHLNVAPATLEEASQQFERANTLLAAGADASRIAGELTQLRQHTDELNGLVDQVQIAPSHIVSFYQMAGGIVIGERAPQGTPSAVAKLDLTHLSAAELHLRLAPTQAVPPALLNNRLATEQPIMATAPENIATGTAAVTPLDAAGERVVIPSAAQPENLALTQSALTDADGAYFRNNYCPNKGFFHYCSPNVGNWSRAEASATHSDLTIAPTTGSGAASVKVQVNGKLLATFAAFNGEVDTWWAMSGKHNVRDSGCCFICACGTHDEINRYTHHWDVTASGMNFHVGGYFMNDPRHLSPE